MRFNHNGVISEITSLPGCSQVAVFHAAFVPADMRGQGLGKVAHDARIREAMNLGYDVAMCTVIVGNQAQEKILRSRGWVQVETFTSSKTNNIIGIWVKTL